MRLNQSHKSSKAPPVAPVSATTFKPISIAFLTALIKFILFPDVVIGKKISLFEPNADISLEKIFSKS